MKSGNVRALLMAVCCLLVASGAMAAEEIVIGHPACLSGSFAKSGEQAVGGIKACVFWVNNTYGGISLNGKKLPLVYKPYDCESKSASVTSLIAHLISVEKVNVIFAPYSSGLTLHGAPIAESQKMLYMDHGGANNEIFEQGFYYIVQSICPASLYHRGTLDMIRKIDPLAKRVALAYEDSEFAGMIMRGAEQHARALNFQVVFKQAYPRQTVDFTAFLSKMKLTGPEVILGGGHVEDSALLNRQMAELDLNVSALSLIAAVTLPAYYPTLSTIAEGVMGISHWEDGVSYSEAKAAKAGMRWIGPDATQFLKLFQMATSENSVPDYRAAIAGAQVLAYVLGVENANSLNSDKVRNSLDRLTFMSFYGKWDIDKNGLQVGHDMVNLQWQNGKQVIVWPEEAQTGKTTYPMPAFAKKAEAEATAH